MIARVWRGHVPTRERADRYVDFVTGHVLPELRQISGHRGAYVLRHNDGEGAEFVVLTLWDSIDAIRAFAGDDPERSVVEPEARALLDRFDDRAVHYTVVHHDTD